MKIYIPSAVCALTSILIFVGLFVTYARAQDPVPNASVSVTSDNGSPTIVAVDGDSTCVFHEPRSVPAAVADFGVVECYVGDTSTELDVFLQARVRLLLNQPIGDDFVWKTHTIGWTLERLTVGPGSVFSYAITLHGVHYTGTF